MKRSQWCIGTALLTLTLLAPTVPASSQPPGPGNGGPGMGGPAREARAHRGLDLTEEQQAKVKDLREQAEAKRVELKKEMKRAQHALKGEFLQDEPDTKRVREAVERIGAVRTKLELQRAEQRLAFRKLLTPEQRDRFLAMGERGRSGRPGPPHRMDRGRPGWPGGHEEWGDRMPWQVDSDDPRDPD